MAKNKLIASIAITAGLLGGGAAGVVLGIPGVSGAQTTTVPNAPSTTAPDGTNPDVGKNCPHKGGTDGTTPGSGTSGTSTGGSVGNVGFHSGHGGGGPRF